MAGLIWDIADKKRNEALIILMCSVGVRRDARGMTSDKRN